MRNLEPAQRTNPKRKILGTNFMVRKFWIRRVKGLTFLLSFGLILHGSTFLPFQEAGAGSQLTTAEVLEQLQLFLDKWELPKELKNLLQSELNAMINPS